MWYIFAGFFTTALGVLIGAALTKGEPGPPGPAGYSPQEKIN